MDYTRPDNINETLSASLVKDKKSIPPWLAIVILIILLIIAFLSFYFIFNKNNEPVKVPIYNGGGLATSTGVINPIRVATSTASTSGTVSTSTLYTPGIEKIFFVIWPDAITGYTFNKAGNVIFQDKATGHVYEAKAPDYVPYKVSNTTINNLHLSYFANDGKTIIFQTINRTSNLLSTYIADIAEYNGKPANMYNNAYLGDKIYDISVSPDGNNAAYVLDDNKKYNSNIYTINVKNRDIKLVYSYPLPHMRVQYHSTDTVAIYQNPSEGKVTQTYNLKLGTQALAPILKEEQLISNISKYGYLYSNKTGTFLQNKSLTSQFSFYTPVNKCVWSRTNTYILCGVNENYSASDLDEYLDQSKVFVDNLYIHGIDYPNEGAIYDFVTFDQVPVHIHSMSISNNNESLAIMDQQKGLYLLHIYTVLSAERN